MFNYWLLMVTHKVTGVWHHNGQSVQHSDWTRATLGKREVSPQPHKRQLLQHLVVLPTCTIGSWSIRSLIGPGLGISCKQEKAFKVRATHHVIWFDDNSTVTEQTDISFSCMQQCSWMQHQVTTHLLLFGGWFIHVVYSNCGETDCRKDTNILITNHWVASCDISLNKVFMSWNVDKFPTNYLSDVFRGCWLVYFWSTKSKTNLLSELNANYPTS